MQNPNPTAHSTLGPPTWTVPSASEAGREYHVIADEYGRYHCGCKAAEFNRSCWHIGAVKAGLMGKPKVRYRPASPLPPLSVDELYPDPPAVSGPITVREEAYV